MRIDPAALLLAAAALAGCGGGGSGAGAAPATGAPPVAELTPADVQRIVAQAVAEAQARGVRANVAVVDRVGNVLGTYAMQGASADTVAISSGRGVDGGLEGTRDVPAILAALSKAMTGAYLSSNGNAFSTRTAGQIVQEHFNPQELGQPAGPLFGVQFSQLPCSDVNLPGAAGTAGPKRTPLGLSADPGGLPLYKNGVLAGGIGIEADGVYGLDRDVVDIDQSPEELVAVAGSFGFAAPADIRGDRITADGRTFRYVDSASLATNPAMAPALASLPVASIAAGSGFVARASGASPGTPASGLAPADPSGFGEAQVLVDAAGAARYPVRAGGDGLLAADEVRMLLVQALGVARRTRAQIRRPLGSHAQVNISVVDTRGEVLGFVRTPDAPVFGIDVSAQKARTALFFSLASAYASVAALPTARYLDDARVFLASPGEFTGITAWTTRAVGNLHRPFYPDGVRGAPHGPFSTPFERWSPFNTGLQLDLAQAAVLAALGGGTVAGCVPGTVLRNGMQVFPGGVPVYRGGVLIGAIGVSGDGVDQDDMVAYLAVSRAASGTGLGHAPAPIRADRYAPHGARLRYVQCPQAPFVDSSEQNVCAP